MGSLDTAPRHPPMFSPSKYKKFKVSGWGHSDSTFEKLKIEGGICRGMCLDWLRRILLSLPAPHVDSNGLIDKTKAKKRYQKQHAMHEAFNSGMDNNILKRKQAAWESKNQSILEEVRQFVEKRNNGIPFSDDENQRIPQLEKMQRIIKRKMADLNQKSGDIADFNEAALPDAYEQFQEAMRSRTHNFDKIEVEVPDTQVSRFSYLPKNDAWQHVNAALSGITAGRCLLVQAGVTDSNDAGHAIAFHHSHTGSICVFDPNFGEFKFAPDELSDLERFFKELWEWHYATYNWLTFMEFRHAEGDAKVSPYDPIPQKQRATCTIA